MSAFDPKQTLHQPESEHQNDCFEREQCCSLWREAQAQDCQVEKHLRDHDTCALQRSGRTELRAPLHDPAH
jgi:hypothetical protein